MASPECGDLILRGSLSAGFLVIDAASQRRLFGPVQLQKAVRLAKEHGAQVIWQQLVDDCGQPLGPPLRFKVPPSVRQTLTLRATCFSSPGKSERAARARRG